MTISDGGDLLSTIPTCKCKRLREGHLLGMICDHCGTPVQVPNESNISSNIWLRAPEEARGFIHPEIWLRLHDILGAVNDKYTLLDWLLLPNTRIPAKATTTLKTRIAFLESIGWERGLNYLADNFEAFIDLLPNLKVRRPRDYQEFFRNHKKYAFPRHLPLPSSSMLIMENKPRGSYADLSSSGVTDAVSIICDISRITHTYNDTAMMTSAAKISKALSLFYRNVEKTTFVKKRGWFRGQLFSSRSHFCMRAVITPIAGPHHYEELHVPWGVGIELFRPQLVGKLLHRGLTIREAITLVESTGKIYHPLIAELLDEITSVDYTVPGSPRRYPGVPVFFQRNPSLVRLSIQNFSISLVKKDIYDQTISMSCLQTRGFNADFDGDEMNATVIMGSYLIKQSEYLRAFYALHPPNKPGELVSAINLPDTLSSTLDNWINTEIDRANGNLSKTH